MMQKFKMATKLQVFKGIIIKQKECIEAMR